jgi:uncharacterized protein (TIGR02611 family)
MRGLRRRIRALPGGPLALKVMVGAVGSVLILLGLALVPLPGPGWAVVFAGLAVLAVEFAWARHALDRSRALVRRGTRWLASLPVVLRYGAAAVLVGLAVTVGWWML